MKIEPYRRRSLAPGLAVSLLIHAGLLALLMTQRPAPPVVQPARWLTVSLLPDTAIKPASALPTVEPRAANPAANVRRTTPAMAQAPVRAPAPHQVDPDSVKDKEPHAPRHDASALHVVPAAPEQAPSRATAESPDPFAAPPSHAAGAFDSTAALKSARKLALAKAGKDDPAVAQLRDKPINGLAAENELGNSIKKGARPDCLMSGAGAGILAPLAIAYQVLTDKKDHGCKW